MKNPEKIVYRCPKFVVAEKDFELPGGRIVRRYPFIKKRTRLFDIGIQRKQTFTIEGIPANFRMLGISIAWRKG